MFVFVVFFLGWGLEVRDWIFWDYVGLEILRLCMYVGRRVHLSGEFFGVNEGMGRGLLVLAWGRRIG